jgi:hypothetical protein
VLLYHGNPYPPSFQHSKNIVTFELPVFSASVPAEALPPTTEPTEALSPSYNTKTAPSEARACTQQLATKIPVLTTSPTDALSPFFNTKTVLTEVRACTSQLANELPILPISMCVAPNEVPPETVSVPVKYFPEVKQSSSICTSSPPASAQRKPQFAGSKKELLRLVAISKHNFESSKSWEEFVGKCRDPGGNLHPNVKPLPRRAAHLLERLRVCGATVDTKTAPWSLQQKLAALSRGSPNPPINTWNSSAKNSST